MSYTRGNARCLGSIAYDPGSNVLKSVTSAIGLTAFDTTNARLTFNAPASGKVQWRIAVGLKAIARTHDAVLLGVLEGSTVRGRMLASVTPVAGGQAVANDVDQRHLMDVTAIISGLTPGQSYTFDAAYSVPGDTFDSGNIEYGGPDTPAVGANGALVFEIWEVVV